MGAEPGSTFMQVISGVQRLFARGDISKTWGREDELKRLKSELASLDRKITAELDYIQ